MGSTGLGSTFAAGRNWLQVWAACALLAAAACSSGGVAPPSPVVTPPSPPVVQDPAPPQLQGTWVTVLKDGTNQQVTLMLGENSYKITRGTDHANGAIAVHGDRIEFSDSTLCIGTGTYRWTLGADFLLFAVAGSEPCGGRLEVLDGQMYKR